ncbi:MAG: glycosyltransferase family 39 protein [Candidatus Riflebacteria bacterium]|nr:glycosyltransferase family 39 protein [Candidatus Riflebacteria bacterium]
MPTTERPGRLLAPVLLLVAAWFLYTSNLGPTTLVGDDEGMNLYPAWRAAMGERLYRDVAFDHTPVAIQLGALLFRWTGPSALAAKKMTVAFGLIGAFFAFLLAETFWGRNRALLALALLVSDSYWHFFSWFFTSDAYFLCFYVASVYMAAKAWQGGGRPLLWLTAGILGAVSVFAKLFGVFAFGGTFLFLLVVAVKPGNDTSRRERALHGAGWMLTGAAATTVLLLAPMMSYLDSFLALCVGHHRKSFQELHPLWVYYAFFNVGWFSETPIAHRLLLFLGVLGLFRGIRDEATDGRVLLACHLVQALAFLPAHLEFYARHLLFTLPFLAIFAAELLAALSAQRHDARRVAVGLGALAFASALFSFSSDLPRYERAAVVEFVRQATEPDDSILAEHWEIPFLAGRRNTPLGEVPAGGGKPEKGIFRLEAATIISAIEKDEPKLVLLLESPRKGEDCHFKGQLANESGLRRHLESAYARVPTTSPDLADYSFFMRR